MSLARTAGVFYVLAIATGFWSLFARGGALAVVANASAALTYAVVVVLLYRLFAPVDARLSTAAAIVGLAGCAASLLTQVGGVRLGFNPLAFFGGYCLLIGTLVMRSTLMPRFVGVLVAIGGVSWLTFAVPPLARLLVPYSFIPGILAETILTIFLLIGGRRTGAEAPGPLARGHATPS
jgi:hypothetical protein